MLMNSCRDTVMMLLALLDPEGTKQRRSRKLNSYRTAVTPYVTTFTHARGHGCHRRCHCVWTAVTHAVTSTNLHLLTSSVFHGAPAADSATKERPPITGDSPVLF